MKYVLTNQIIFESGNVLYPGTIIDDSQYDIALLRKSGGRIEPTPSSDVEEQSEVALKLRRAGRIQSLQSLDVSGGVPIPQQYQLSWGVAPPFMGPPWESDATNHILGCYPAIKNGKIVFTKVFFDATPLPNETLTLDLLKNGMSILSAPLVIDASMSPSVLDYALASTDLAVGDILESKVHWENDSSSQNIHRYSVTLGMLWEV